MSVTPIPEAMRWQVWGRDDFRCRSCGSRMFLVIDHVLPEAHGGETVMDNLQTLCAQCNARKGAHITAFIKPGEECGSIRCWCLTRRLQVLNGTVDAVMGLDVVSLSDEERKAVVHAADAAREFVARWSQILAQPVAQRDVDEWESA